jgi:BASS family bile acid:Na+ symporter
MGDGSRNAVSHGAGFWVVGFPYSPLENFGGGNGVCFSIGIGAFSPLRGYQYTGWIITAVIAGLVYPDAFLKWGFVDLRNRWLILVIVQMVMFGMGIQMGLKDFSNLGSTGKGVLIGLLSQFSIMPVLGYLLTQVFAFEPEIAAGIILMGSCSSGLASNVMVYLAKANLLLSVTVTAMATLLAPLLTPFWMKTFAGTLIDISFLGMMLEIVKIVLVPIGAALLHDYLKTAPLTGIKAVASIGVFAGLVLCALWLGGWKWLETTMGQGEMMLVETLAFFCGAVLVGIAYHLINRRCRTLDKLMPYLSMFGIIYFTTVTTAAGRDHLLQVGCCFLWP